MQQEVIDKLLELGFKYEPNSNSSNRFIHTELNMYFIVSPYCQDVYKELRIHGVSVEKLLREGKINRLFDENR